MKKILVLPSFVFLLFIAHFFPVYAQTQTHPFLIVKESEYPLLRSRATKSPWKEMKASANTDCINLSYTPSQLNGADKAWRMRDIVSACSLSYLLEDPQDPNNKKAQYRQKITQTIPFWDSDIIPFQAGFSGWEQQVPPGSAFFNSVLAFDIIYNDLIITDRNAISATLQKEASLYLNGYGWGPNGSGVLGIWTLFNNDPNFSHWRDQYKIEVLNQFTSDGVFINGTEYAGARFAGIRDAKSSFIDVLQYTGSDTSYYTDPKLKNFYEWYYGYATTPFEMDTTFGDSAAFYGIDSLDYNFSDRGEDTSSHIASASRFSALAGSYAFWKNGGKSFPGRLLQYVLMPDPIPAVQTPVSRIFKDGGGFFLEKNATKQSLYGALWNLTQSGGHSHRDVNAIYIAGYGEPLLLNSGYNGWGNGDLGFSRNYISDRAVSNNVALMNYTIGNVQDPNDDGHQKSGNGVTEGFTGASLDYASGDSGSAIPGGSHIRNFIFIYPQDGKNGYFVTMDELSVSGGNSTSKVNLAFHPNADSTTLRTVTSNTEYEAKIGPYRIIPIPSAANTGIDLYFGTAPSSISITDGVLAYWDNEPPYKAFAGKYLFNTYNANSNGKKNIVTVLFPFDPTHSKASMSRISGTSYSGASIDHGGGVVDTALENSSGTTITNSGVTFQGLASLYRKNGTTTSFYFVRKGRSFDDGGGSARKGFISSADASVFLKDTTGNIITTASTQVTFYYPQMTGVYVDNQFYTGSTVIIPAGNHTLKIIASGGSTSTPGPSSTPTPAACIADLNTDHTVNQADLLLILQNFGSTTSSYDINSDSKVNMQDAVYILKNWGVSC